MLLEANCVRCMFYFVYSKLVPSCYLAKQNCISNFWKAQYKKKLLWNVVENGPAATKEMSFFKFSIFCSCRHFVLGSRMGGLIMIANHPRNTPMNFKRNWPGDYRGDFVESFISSELWQLNGTIKKSLLEDHPRNNPMKFDQNWHSSYREDAV